MRDPVEQIVRLISGPYFAARRARRYSPLGSVAALKLALPELQDEGSKWGSR
jgi:hypothetical protein